MNCRMDGGEIVPVWDLGNLCVSDFVDTPEKGEQFPLRLGIGRTSGLLQLMDTYPADKLYGRRYWYRSGLNESMRTALADVFHGARRYVDLASGDVCLDIGANDGTLLGNVPMNCTAVGAEPAPNLQPFLTRAGYRVIPTFFQAHEYWKLKLPAAKIITSVAMFYDLDDPQEFVDDIAACLDRDGVWVCQMSYLPLMLEQLAWDNICAEHVTYWALTQFQKLLETSGLMLVDVEFNTTNGGSFRIYAMHANAYHKLPCYQRDLADMRIESALNYEDTLHYDSLPVLADFQQRAVQNNRRLVDFLIDCRDRGKSVIGYGASTKGNTLLQVAGITADLLPAIADRSEWKWGKFCAGSGIPVISEEEMRARKPDYLLTLPWHFMPSFKKREQALLAAGTQFVVPLPQFEVVG
jgi:hypothetical protein